jgi:uncharacterized protein (DUF1697 family)
VYKQVKMATQYVALFRGINVGGHHSIRMDELKRLHEFLGMQDVLSFIQSGNIVFRSDGPQDPVRLVTLIEDAFEKRFGFHSKVLVRTGAELTTIIAGCHFESRDSLDPRRLVVMFMSAVPGDREQTDLLQSASGPEELKFSGTELYIYYPDGMGRSRLSNSVIEKKLKTFGTARNWNTVLQLQKLAAL